MTMEGRKGEAEIEGRMWSNIYR